MKILSLGAKLFLVDRPADMTKLIVTFHNFAIAPKNHKKCCELRLIRPQTQTKNPEYMYLSFFTPLAPSVEKIVNLHYR